MPGCIEPEITMRGWIEAELATDPDGAGHDAETGAEPEGEAAEESDDAHGGLAVGGNRDSGWCRSAGTTLKL